MPGRARLAGLALIAGIAMLGLGSGPQTSDEETSPSSRHAELEHAKIRHVVIIIQENRSFDNLFNGFPGADTVKAGMSHDGLVPLRPVDLAYPVDVDHQHRAFLKEYDAGKMDGFDDVETSPRQRERTFPYAFVPRNQVEPYWKMAEEYTLGDRTFQSNSGPSFPAHLYLIAGQSDYTANNPNHIETSHFAWGCDSPENASLRFFSVLVPLSFMAVPLKGEKSLD